ncbi:hypothetical protein COV42_00735 [Candidatus Campbellbacteria bacterium CG11_big_fil_rev_8_21_14_0_20_44_21]|uniref:Uncharacterized protein n=1 Tax=Candidatus Campbellbacteria bacterium CG22_combo_CG10-13_8_21_14_all_43_18 TaxID=1974530 RepID=A0A2H0DYF6_9BACT|nr:MAG: hypothetical protein COW82_00390 [Candidatus Campbellbacteria bacterium CG22_combo_CG10-13_8_21_14_all_43_18]PIR24431.1 MAG: hypothetical protein COV42_00735 [Candidatus Campbellbacteria bacterium CG11_big_fil_rev_8_21_14_0_20_44_21]
MNLLFWGLLAGVLGKVIIGLSVVAVHVRIMKEHKLDKKVYHSIRNEKFWGIVGVLLMVAGFFLEIAYYTETGLI